MKNEEVKTSNMQNYVIYKFTRPTYLYFSINIAPSMNDKLGLLQIVGDEIQLFSVDLENNKVGDMVFNAKFDQILKVMDTYGNLAIRTPDKAISISFNAQQETQLFASLSVVSEVVADLANKDNKTLQLWLNEFKQRGISYTRLTNFKETLIGAAILLVALLIYVTVESLI